MSDHQPGWYQDPSGDVSKLRYWNGTQWTDDFIDASQAAPVSPYQQPTYGNPPSGPYGTPQTYYQPNQGASNNDVTLRLIAFVFCIVSTVAVGWALIPLAWMIPMTVHCWGIYKGTKPNTTAFGVCTLIFVNVVGGILLLVSRKDR